MIRWERLSVLRTPALMLVALVLLVIGAAHSPWAWSAWIVAGVGVFLMAYLTDAPIADQPAEVDANQTQNVAQLNTASAFRTGGVVAAR
jgi:O-antigen/teichoic acid export membrane protein